MPLRKGKHPLLEEAQPTPPASVAPSIPSTRSKRKRSANAEDNSSALPVKSVRRQGTSARTGLKSGEMVDLAADEPLHNFPGKDRRGKSLKPTPKPAPERRARIFRSAPPKSFQQRLQRAVTQRMFVVGQTVAGTDEVPELRFDIVGTTGNIYKTVIGKEPTCSCPDSLKGNQCKHICYVLVKVLKAPAHLQYQLAFLSSELRDIYQNSPLRTVQNKAEEPDTDGNRKPIEGDCAICFTEFEPDKEEIVWCRAACGNNIHKTCFQKWAATQGAQNVRCVYCRAPWQTEDADGKVDIDLQQLLGQGEMGDEGYVNVASQMGLSGERDCSTYYQPWVHRRSYYSGWHSRSYWY